MLLALAKAKGYKVPDEMINKTKPYLKDIEKHFDDWYKNSPQVRWTISAYALYVRDLMGDKDVAKAKKLLLTAEPEQRRIEKRCRSRHSAGYSRYLPTIQTRQPKSTRSIAFPE